VIAVGVNKKIPVPDLAGKTFLEASAALREVGLQAGAQPDDPNAKVTASDPQAGVKVEKGSPVQLFFAKAGQGGTTGATGSTGSTGSTASSSTSTTSHPPPKAGAAALAAAAAQAGELNPQKLGIVFDNGKGDIFVVGADDGKPLKPLIKSDDFEDEPAVDKTGNLIAFERGPANDPSRSQIWLFKKGDRFPHALTSTGFRDHRPAFSPDGQTIAFIRDRPIPGGPKGTVQGDLCFIRVTATGDTPNCVGDPANNVQRPVWSREGTTIVARSEAVVKPQRVDFVLFTSQRPNSPSAGDWNLQANLTKAIQPDNKGVPQAFMAAFSPDGKQLAFTANYKTGLFHLFLAPVKNGVPNFKDVKVLTRIASCEVAWQPAGPLAIVQRDPTSCESSGVIARLDPPRFNQVTPLTQVGFGGSNPAWTLAPPK
jgi:PASTA domain/WD40-like Beta Propeller Repeat